MATDFPYLLYECNNFLLLDKPHEMPTVPLKTQSLHGTLLEQAGKICPEILEVQGKNPWEGGALHRLDTATSGIVLFAKNQKFYEEMQKIQENNLFEKYYIARTFENKFFENNFSENKVFENNSLKCYDIEEKTGVITISSYFKPYGPKGKEVRATLDGKKAKPKTIYQTAVIKNENIFYCTITKGFRHQIRAHLAWTGHPIIGDSLYGQSPMLEGQSPILEGQSPILEGQSPTLQLECVGISFPVMENGEEKCYTFKKKDTLSLRFPSLSRYANTIENVIIQL